MVRIEAIIRPEKFEVVKTALQQIGVIAMTVDQVLGCGHQAGHVEHYRGMETHINLLPKIRITTVVHEVDPDDVVTAICDAAGTGEHEYGTDGRGDGFALRVVQGIQDRRQVHQGAITRYCGGGGVAILPSCGSGRGGA